MKVILNLDIESVDANKFFDAMKPDFVKKGRSEIDMFLEKNKLKFTISSEDFTSVRASINNILLKLRAMNELGNK